MAYTEVMQKRIYMDRDRLRAAYTQFAQQLEPELFLTLATSEPLPAGAGSGSLDALLEVQGILSGLLFGWKMDIGYKLEDLTREFDRLDDPYIRDYWFKKFKAGESWPVST